MAILSNKSNLTFRCFLLVSFFTLTSCTMFMPVHTYDDFVLVKAKPWDKLSSLAAKYLNDPSKDRLIAEFNHIDTLSWGQDVIIPLKPFKRGGLEANGYQAVPVLVYHTFSKNKTNKMTVSETAFNEQMRFLKENRFRVITLEQFLDFLNLKGQLPEKSVVITIDDGWRSVYEIAFPILKKYGFPVTLFVYTDLIGTPKGMSWQQVKELSKNGFDIQNHTKTHRSVVKPRGKETFKEYFNAIEREVVESGKLLKNKVNKKCKFIAYPYGETNDLFIALLKKNGYHGAFTMTRGSNPCFVNNYKINRSPIYGEYTLEKFKRNLTVFKETKLK